MRRLAASFVVTTAVLDCRAHEPDPPYRSAPELERGADGVCRYYPPGSSGGNPPEVYEVECPPNLGGPPNDARPKGKEGWLRAPPWITLEYGSDKCRVYGEELCPAPPADAPCVQPPDLGKFACERVDGGQVLHVEPLVWTDTMGRCHRVAAFDCSPGGHVPDGEIVGCD